MLEGSLVALFVLLGPLIGRLIAERLGGSVRGLGVASLVDLFQGGRPFTDIGWEVASARALVDPVHSMYEKIDVLARLIDMSAYDVGSHTHPPTSVVMWIPLGYLPYSWWISFYACAALVALGLSMRVMGVPAWLAYPVAGLLALTPTGTFALTTTYPVMALALALTWQYRDRGAAVGLGYAVLAAARGVGGVLVIYPLLRRQWRTVAVAVGALAVAATVALILEPSSFAEFFDRGAGSVDALLQQTNVFTPMALLARRGLPVWLAYVVPILIVIAAITYRRNFFWGLFWLSAALTPLGWIHSLFGAIPFFVVMWRSGRLGAVLVLTNVVVALGVLPFSVGAFNLAWLTMIATGAVAVLGCNLDGTEDRRGPILAA